MSEGQSQCSVALSAQHWEEAKVATAEERERVAAEAAATAARVARLAMVAVARAEVEVAWAARAEVESVDLEALRASSIGSSVFANDDIDNELKLVWEEAQDQAV
jgi:hypothetical protein